MASRLILFAIAAPVSPEMRAWLSLVGIPRFAVSTAQTITAKSPADTEHMAVLGSSPNSAIPYMVFATEGLIIAIKNAPEKLQIAATLRATSGVKARPEIQPATALGASVQPFTSTTKIISAVNIACISLLLLLYNYAYEDNYYLIRL
jgi:Zn-dependent alcohol dehydrogenase